MKTKREIRQEVVNSLKVSDFKKPYIYKMGGTQTVEVEGLGRETFDDREYYSGRGAKYNKSINRDNKGVIYITAAEVEDYVKRITELRWDAEKAANIYRRQKREYEKEAKRREASCEELTITAKDCDVYTAAAVVEFAAKKGFEVSEEAIQHNLDAWHSDCKSGYRDSIYHVFSHCGCNPLRYTLSRISEGCESWQKTYLA